MDVVEHTPSIESPYFLQKRMQCETIESMGNPANRYKPPVATGIACGLDTATLSEYASPPAAAQAPVVVSLFKKRVVAASASNSNHHIRLEEFKDPQLSGALRKFLRSVMLFSEAFDLSTADINTFTKALNLCFIRWNKADNIEARVFETRQIPPIELFSRYYRVSTKTPEEISALFAVPWESVGLSELYNQYWSEQMSKNKAIPATAISSMSPPVSSIPSVPLSVEVVADDRAPSSTPTIEDSIPPDTPSLSIAPSPTEAIKLPKVHRNSTITGNRLHFMNPLLAIKPTIEITEEAFKTQTVLALLEAMQSIIPLEKQSLCEGILSWDIWNTSWRRSGDMHFLWVSLNQKSTEQILPTLRVFGISQASLVQALRSAKVPLTGEILVQIPTI
jgi:hypothetical protein